MVMWNMSLPAKAKISKSKANSKAINMSGGWGSSDGAQR